MPKVSEAKLGEEMGRLQRHRYFSYLEIMLRVVAHGYTKAIEITNISKSPQNSYKIAGSFSSEDMKEEKRSY